MSTAKCKIPVGSYYGHTLILPGEDYAEKNPNSASCETNIKVSIIFPPELILNIPCSSLPPSCISEFARHFYESYKISDIHKKAFRVKIGQVSGSLENFQNSRLY